MNRRKFLYGAVAGAAGTTAAIGLTKAVLGADTPTFKETRSVTYQVRGFTCVTCATGLEVTLLQQKGVARAHASYPEARVNIGFDASLTSEQALKAVIVDCGFSVS